MIRPPLASTPILDPLRGARGFNLNDDPNDSRLMIPSFWDSLQATGAKLVRIFIDVWDTGSQFVIAPGALVRLDLWLALASSRSLRIVPTVKVGATNQGAKLWTSAAYQASLVELWAVMAVRYQGNPHIAGFDVCNEPFGGPEGLNFRQSNIVWFDLAQSIAGSIWAADASRVVILQPSPGGRPLIFEWDGPDLPPWAFGSRVVWSFHMYEPFLFTHQLVQGVQNATSALVYPGMVPGEDYPYGELRNRGLPFWVDKEFLRSVLEPVRAFQLRVRTPIYIGEFSAVRWSINHSHRLWLTHCLELFKEYGWSWTFHCFRGWFGWDYEQDWSSAQSAQLPDPGNSPGWQMLLLSLSEQ